MVKLQGLLENKNSSNNQSQIYNTKSRLSFFTRARWIILSFLLFYSLVSTAIYVYLYSYNKVLGIVGWPVVCLAVVTFYSVFYQLYWNKYKPNRGINKNVVRSQLILDAIVVTCLIYFTGGIESWFWTLYVLLAIEYSEVLQDNQETIIYVLSNLGLYTLLIIGEYFSVIVPVIKPFTSANQLHHNLPYIAVAWLWVGTITISSVLIIFRYRHVESTSIRDDLTGLYNRAFFNHCILSEIERAKRFKGSVSMLMIDVDNFKEYNDEFGHLKGDLLLKEIGRLINDNLRSSEYEPTYDVDVAFRYGGEEFCVLAPGDIEQENTIISHNNGSYVLAQRLRTQIEKVLNGEITISIGVASFPFHAKSSDGLIHAADKALYKAKFEGKNRVEVATTKAKETEKEVEIEKVSIQTYVNEDIPVTSNETNIN